MKGTPTGGGKSETISHTESWTTVRTRVGSWVAEAHKRAVRTGPADTLFKVKRVLGCGRTEPRRRGEQWGGASGARGGEKR